MKKFFRELIFGPTETFADPREQLFSGVEKPTTSLAKMIAAELLMDTFLDTVNWKQDEYVDPKGRFSLTWTENDCIDPDISIMHIATAQFNRETGSAYPVTSYSDARLGIRRRAKTIQSERGISLDVSVVIEGVTLDKNEITIVTKALGEARSLHSGRAEAKRLAENQQKAVDALANWLGVPPPPPSVPAPEFESVMDEWIEDSPIPNSKRTRPKPPARIPKV